MAPSKSSRNVDEQKADIGGSKEKNSNLQTATKMRRGVSQTSVSQLREAANAPASAPTSGTTDTTTSTLNWSSFDRATLHAYRREYQLNTPTSFASSYHQWVLSWPGGIGIYSPTMARKNKCRRQSKDQLATAVRKHFNGVGIQENDVIVDFIHRIRNDTTIKAGASNRHGILAKHA